MFSTQLRVRYADTDAMGVVYHANYLVWFEVGRVELMRSWGLPHSLFEKRGIFVPVIEASARYLYPARYDDLLEVRTKMADLSAARTRFAYEIVRAEDGHPICEGRTLHAFVNLAGRPVALPRAAPDLYEGFKAKVQEFRTPS